MAFLLVNSPTYSYKEPCFMPLTHKALFIFILSICATILSFSQTPVKNSSIPLVTPTYENSGQAMHPCIIDFLTEHHKNSWGGYRYWMIMTPFPFEERYFENPSLLVSQDGKNWKVPPGIRNPIVNSNPPFNNADPDLIYNSATNELWLYYGKGGHKQAIGSINVLLIKENLSIIPPVEIFHFERNNFDSAVMSPCVWMESENRWHMWGVFINYPNSFIHKFSTDGIHWGKSEICTNKDGKDPFTEKGLRPWHPSCKPNYQEHRIEFLVSSRSDTSKDSPQSMATYLIYAECQMDHPTILSLPLNAPVLSKADTGWDCHKIYRSTFVIEDLNFGYNYRIWYSAENRKKKWGIGYTQGFLGTAHTPDSTKRISNFYYNPKSNKCIITLRVKKIKSTAEIEVFNKYSQKMEIHSLSTGKNNIIIDPSRFVLPPYYYVVKIDSTIIERVKL